MNILNNIYRYFFPTPTVGSIMVSFQKQQDALMVLVDGCRSKEVALTDTLMTLEADLIATAQERNKAQSISRKLADFTA